MAYEQKNMKGGAFHNDKKGNERAPDYKGSAKIEDKDYWVAIWNAKSQEGKEYLSISFELKGEPQPEPETPKEEVSLEAISADVPF